MVNNATKYLMVNNCWNVSVAKNSISLFLQPSASPEKQPSGAFPVDAIYDIIRQ